MKCNEIRELMPDLAAGLSAATPEINQHLQGCGECEAKLNAFRQTMAIARRVEGSGAVTLF